MTNACHIEVYHQACDTLLWLQFSNSEERTLFESQFEVAVTAIIEPLPAGSITVEEVTNAVSRDVAFTQEGAIFLQAEAVSGVGPEVEPYGAPQGLHDYNM